MAGRGRGVAFTAALAVGMIQIVLATVDERVAPARYPFAPARMLAALEEGDQRLAVLAFVVARSPSLLALGRTIV